MGFCNKHFKALGRYNDWVPSTRDIFLNKTYLKNKFVAHDGAFKISEAVLDTSKNLSKDFCFSPFLFIAWDFYRTGSLGNSIITCCRDFMWPVAAITAKSLNASPY